MPPKDGISCWNFLEKLYNKCVLCVLFIITCSLLRLLRWCTMLLFQFIIVWIIHINQFLYIIFSFMYANNILSHIRPFTLQLHRSISNGVPVHACVPQPPPNSLTHSLQTQWINYVIIFLYSHFLFAQRFMYALYVILESLVKCEQWKYVDDDDNRIKTKTDWNRMCHFLDVLCMPFIFLVCLVISASYSRCMFYLKCNIHTHTHTPSTSHCACMCIDQNRRRVQVHTLQTTTN